MPPLLHLCLRCMPVVKSLSASDASSGDTSNTFSFSPPAASRSPISPSGTRASFSAALSDANVAETAPAPAWSTTAEVAGEDSVPGDHHHSNAFNAGRPSRRLARLRFVEFSSNSTNAAAKSLSCANNVDACTLSFSSYARQASWVPRKKSRNNSPRRPGIASDIQSTPAPRPIPIRRVRSSAIPMANCIRGRLSRNSWGVLPPCNS